LVDWSKYGFRYERTVQDAVKENVDIITFSGDKMLGGPQAGIIVGKKEYIEQMKKNQMYRCFRIDKMCLIALESTLRQYMTENFLDIPVIKAILEPSEVTEEKANELNEKLKDITNIKTFVAPHNAMIGGGAVPGEFLDSYAVYISSESKSISDMEAYLRSRETPIISTVQNEKIILDLRTINKEDFDYIADILKGVELL
jgi:L-seryl-tRNA(Ser) seleniumtransferase